MLGSAGEAPTGRAAAAAPRLSAVLIVLNEERHLAECLESVRGLADEIVVVDSGSHDATVAIATAAGAQVTYRPFDGYGAQKQAALELARGEWVLSLDADERVTPALADEIRAVLASPDAADGYWVRRELVYLGRLLRHGGADTDWVLRLARRERARFSADVIHEHLTVTGGGRERRVRGTLVHLKYRTLSEHLDNIDRYTTTIAARKGAQGRRFAAWQLLRVQWELFHRLVLRLGLLDGAPGVIWATMNAFYAFLKYAKLYPAAPATDDGRVRGTGER